MYADHICGPWSDLSVVIVFGGIDPGHVVGEDGKRYIFLSGGGRFRLTDDGLELRARWSRSIPDGSIRKTGMTRHSA